MATTFLIWQLVNVDFADVRSVVEGAGMGLVSMGRANGSPVDGVRM